MTRRPTLTAFAALLTASLWMLASASIASANQRDPGARNIPQEPTVVTTVVHDGTPLWVFALVAAVAISLAIAATLAWQSVRAHRAEQMSIGRTRHA
jgi:hypothetical protein